MARFLSPEWLDHLNSTVSDADSPAAAGVRLVIQQVVSVGDEPVVYHLRVAGGRFSFAPGPAPDADVTIHEDLATATAIARGDLSPREALLAGRIRVAGNVGALVAGQVALAGLDAALEKVRASTTF